MDEKKPRTLADIPAKQECVIVKVNGHGGFRHRVMEMGFVKGQKVTVLKNAPLLDPIEYKIMQSHISLRRSEASHIEVVSVSESEDESQYIFNGTISEEVQRRIKQETNNRCVGGKSELRKDLLLQPCYRISRKGWQLQWCDGLFKNRNILS
jgi:Fe2+ transport system protein FeoA